MKAIKLNTPRFRDSSLLIFQEEGKFFPCPIHFHDEFEITLIIKSRGKRYVGDNISTFTSGDLVFLGPLIPHAWINDQQISTDNNEAKALVLHFKEELFTKEFINLPEVQIFKKLLLQSRRGIRILGEDQEFVSSTMQKMIHENKIQRLSSLLRILGKLSNSSNLEHLLSPDYIIQYRNDSVKFSNLISFIKLNFSQKISIEEAAALSNMAVSTFCSVFKRSYGVTFNEFLNKVRITHACLLLRKDIEMNISEIAYKSGYDTLVNFNRQFKRNIGRTPSEYRNSIFDISNLVNRDLYKKEFISIYHR